MKKEHLQNGFILVATLWILAAITLATGFFALWTQNALNLARQSQDDLQEIIDMQNTESVLFYLLSTQHKTIAGLTIPADLKSDHSIAQQQRNKARFLDPLQGSILPLGGEIALDDTPYRGIGNACFSIQDEGGLVSLSFSLSESSLGRSNIGSLPLEKLLGLLGVPAPERGPLIDKLLDYTDEDDLHRLNGAEAKDYEKQGLSPPPNRILLTSWETRNILGWNDKYSELWKNGLLPRLTTVASGGIPNLNTAPKLVLKTIANVDDETAEQIINARKQKPFSYPGEVSLAAGKKLFLDPFGLPFFPSSRLRITLWCHGKKRIREIHLRQTPKADKKAPWLIDYELSLAIMMKYEETDLQTLSISAFTMPLSANPE